MLTLYETKQQRMTQNQQTASEKIVSSTRNFFTHHSSRNFVALIANLNHFGAAAHRKSIREEEIENIFKAITHCYVLHSGETKWWTDFICRVYLQQFPNS